MKTGITVVYQDKYVLAVSKPHGMPCIPERNGKTGASLIEMLQKAEPQLIPVHRIDAGTGGLVLLAKDPQTHRFINQQFEKRIVKKKYLALVKGICSWPFSCFLPISAKPAHGKYRVNFSSGKQAVTSFIPLKAGERHTLIEAFPYTGRTHQIRIHLKSCGFPLAADYLYSEASSDRRISLFAQSLEFDHPEKGKTTVNCPLTNYFCEFCDVCGIRSSGIQT